MSERRTIVAGALLALLGATPPTSGQALRDPTRPPRAPASEGSEAAARHASRVSSVLIAGGRRLAIVNGRAVRVGDLLEEGEVVAIEPGGLRVLGIEGSTVLPLFETPVRKEPARPPPDRRGP